MRTKTEAKRLQGSLIEFFRASWPSFDPAPYVHGDHLEAIAQHLEAVNAGTIRKLVINVPPRHSKTLLVSVAWPIWTWAQEQDEDFPLVGPQVKFLCLSYSDHLALDSATTARRLIASEWFQRHWGNRVQITEDQDAKNKFDTTAGGSRISSSIGGTVTGRGGDIKIIDDPHKMDEVESEVAREAVIRKYDTTLKSRITDPRHSAEVLIAQRGHEADLSHHILKGGDAVHLCLPAEYDRKRHCVTVLGWEDWRHDDGELLWPQRFGPDELAPYKTNPYEWSGQWQQSPTTRGGNIFRDEWWQNWEPADGKYPVFDYVVASLDSAFTEKEENDPSGFTVWGIWRDDHDVPKVMLIDAWRKWLRIHGPRIDRKPNETTAEFELRTRPQWGLCEWVAHTCRLRKVDRLLIEAKASGIDVAHEMQRIYGDERWSVQIEQVKGDKVSRAHAVVPAFTQGLIYAPDRAWADMVIEEMASFPKGVHDDLTDSATQALKHLRAVGLIQQPEERANDMMRKATHRSRPQPLYQV